MPLLFLLLLITFIVPFDYSSSLPCRKREKNTKIPTSHFHNQCKPALCGWAWPPSSINKRTPPLPSPCVIRCFSASVHSTWKRCVGVRDLLCETLTVPVRCTRSACVDCATHRLLLSRSCGGYSSGPVVDGGQSVRIVSRNKVGGRSTRCFAGRLNTLIKLQQS